MNAALTRATLRLAVLALFALASPALADMVGYNAELNGSREVPPNDSKGTGMVNATLDTATMKFSYTVTYSGLTGPATAAHFHGPAKADANAGPIITLEKLPSPMTGEATLTAEQAKQLADGLWYLNVHTAAHPPGEIRGQLIKKLIQK